MVEQISDTERLDLNDSTTGNFMENQSTQNPAPIEWTDTQHNSHVEEMPQTKQHLQELQEGKIRTIRCKSQNTRQTLRQLDRKLDRIHQDLAQAGPSPGFSSRGDQKQNRGAKNQKKGLHFENTVLVECSNRGAKR